MQGKCNAWRAIYEVIARDAMSQQEAVDKTNDIMRELEMGDYISRKGYVVRRHS